MVMTLFMVLRMMTMKMMMVDDDIDMLWVTRPSVGVMHALFRHLYFSLCQSIFSCRNMMMVRVMMIMMARSFSSPLTCFFIVGVMHALFSHLIMVFHRANQSFGADI